MKNSQSKFSREKSQSNASSSYSNSGKPSGCCCGSKLSDDIDEIEMVDIEEK